MWLSSLTSINFSGIVLPISLQSMMAILIPLIFRSNVGVAAIGLYLVLGALGLPVDLAAGNTFILPVVVIWLAFWLSLS
jgi:biotin transporter BioY